MCSTQKLPLARDGSAGGVAPSCWHAAAISAGMFSRCVHTTAGMPSAVRRAIELAACRADCSGEAPGGANAASASTLTPIRAA
jgi:hypothetical protein